MPITLTPDKVSKMLVNLARRVATLENTSPLGAGSATAGTTRWKDASAVDQVIVGLESDGSYGVWVGSGGQIKLAATGNLTITGALSIPDHNAFANVPTTAQNGVKIFIQTSDPGAAANNGDIWINTT